ncbi:MAG: hypothetical protein ACTSUO_04645 [Candidatus Thorarchaeota archaeon]
MDKNLKISLKERFDSWVKSPDGTKLLALKKRGPMAILDSSTGEQLLSIPGEYEKCMWLGNDEVFGHDYIITTVFDAKTGKKLRNVEAMYDRD